MDARSVIPWALLALLVLTSCAYRAPKYAWHRPGASGVLSEQDRTALNADEASCVEERNRSGTRMFWGAAWYEAAQKSAYKDCMEARGWAKE